MASGINNTFRQVGIATGVAALGAVFQSQVSTKLAELAPDAPPRLRRRGLVGRRAGRAAGGAAGQPGEPATAANQAFISGFNEILLVARWSLIGSLAGFALVRSRDFVAEHSQQAAEPAAA